MRVFVDTNVVLTGAFNPFGPAGTLIELIEHVEFVYSPRVLDECRYLIQREAPNPQVAQEALSKTQSFLAELSAGIVSDCAPPPGIVALDADDDLLLGAAIAGQANAICTYNVKDFPTQHITVCTPLTLHRLIGKPKPEHYIQETLLSKHGTLLLFGRLHHESSMGALINSDTQVHVIANDRGFIELKGAGVKRCRPHKPLSGNSEFRLTIRYNTSDFEAALWVNHSGTWLKDILTTGSANFSDSTTPSLCFVPNHHFSGHIQCISGLPKFVSDKQLRSALDNYSLEASAGSLDLRKFLSRAHR